MILPDRLFEEEEVHSAMRAGRAEQRGLDGGRAEGEGVDCGGGRPPPERVGLADLRQPEHSDHGALLRRRRQQAAIMIPCHHALQGRITPHVLALQTIEKGTLILQALSGLHREHSRD